MTLYIVVRADGTPKTRWASKTVVAYRVKHMAQRGARDPGDSVVPVELDLSREPLFIRGAKP